MSNFEKYPDISIVADPFDPVYKVKYTECVKENGTIRFCSKIKFVPKKNLESIVEDLVEKII